MINQVMSVNVKPSQVMSAQGQVRSGQVRTIEDEVKSGQGLVSSGKGQVKSGQAMSCHISLGQFNNTSG